MKRFITFIAFAILCIQASAQVSVGGYTQFPDAGIIGALWKPQMTFARINEQNVVVVRSSGSTDYYSFDEDSRVLIRFADSTVVKLLFIPTINVEKDYDAHYSSGITTQSFVTYSCYEVEDETIEKIVNEQTPIVKIRLAYANGTVRDYDIKKSYQKKFIQGLTNSYNKAVSDNAARQRNATDEDF